MRTYTIAAAAAALIGAPGALAATGHTSTRITIRTLQTQTAITFVDADHSGGASVGDFAVIVARHHDPATHKVVGSGTAICTQMDAGGTAYDCQGEDRFSGGELREAGRSTGIKGFRFAILGGTGAYAGAQGEVRGIWLDKSMTKARDQFTFTTLRTHHGAPVQ